MKGKIEIKAIIYALKTNAEGDSKITFSVPRTELAKVIGLNLYLEKVLDITISPEIEEVKRKLG